MEQQALIAQLVEQVTLNHWVLGSSPRERTILSTATPGGGFFNGGFFNGGFFIGGDFSGGGFLLGWLFCWRRYHREAFSTGRYRRGFLKAKQKNDCGGDV